MTTEQRLERIEKMLKQLLEGPKKKETWIKISHLKMLTVWSTKEQFRTAREAGLVRYKKTSDGIFYLLESINPLFIKSTLHANNLDHSTSNRRLHSLGGNQ